MSYLRSHKFSVNLKILKNYVENEVFPSLGIEKKQPYARKQHGNGLENWDGNLEPLLLEYNDKDLTILIEKDIPPEEKMTCSPSQNPKPLRYRAVRNWPNFEGYWKVKMLAKQLEQAIDILEIALPNTIFVFGFNNSTNHGAFTKDALIARRMNVGYAGKQPKLCPGRFPDGMPQEMVFPLNHRDNNKKGQPKGIKEVMIERKIWNEQLRGKCVKCSKDEEEICCNMKKL
ncbi:1890_t:CDS:2, partial [Gigaspora rosea]